MSAVSDFIRAFMPEDAPTAEYHYGKVTGGIDAVNRKVDVRFFSQVTVPAVKYAVGLNLAVGDRVLVLMQGPDAIIISEV